MSTIVTRAGKGSPLTHNEVDANFNNLNTDKVEKTSADITGGTINGTTIGATTPAAGTFTTITGQTEVLRGTGQNLLGFSQAIGGTNWSAQGTASVVLNAVVAPDSTTTASTLTLASGGYYRQITGASNRILSGVTYTFSCYVKASASGGATNVRLTTNNTVAWNTGFSTRFTLTSSWQRVSVTGTITGTDAYFIIGAIDATGTNDATCAGNVDVWGAQFELGSVANTYIATTGTVIYGTPTLSFSGVSTIGLEQTGALYLQPAGTGAIQAQATTSTTAGGNARGANAVDWQTLRTSAGQVASGAYATIGGGYRSTASSSYGTVAGGDGNLASGNYATVAGGSTNTASGYMALVNGGYLNTAAGFYNFIGGGFTNSGTANAAVTTQVGATTSGSTAVTLTGSNANIRVGQYISGTGIAGETYVAAISGTSLTLSQNAASSQASTTLSFRTPHGVVVGGGNNQATGAYSFIGGGGDAGTAGNRNVASGDWSVVCGGQSNIASGNYAYIVGGFASTASGIYSSIAGGAQHTASNNYATVCGGQSNTASGNTSAVLGGFINLANSSNSVVMGGQYGTSRGITGNTVFVANNSSVAGSAGVAQSALLVLGTQTTDATATVLRSTSAAAGTTNQVILPNNSAYYFKIEVIAGRTAAGDTKAWELKGAIKRGANAGTTTLVGTVTSTVIAENAGASAWTVTATADTTNGGIKVEVTGQASTTIRWVARCTTVEMTF